MYLYLNLAIEHRPSYCSMSFSTGLFKSARLCCPFHSSMRHLFIRYVRPLSTRGKLQGMSYGSFNGHPGSENSWRNRVAVWRPAISFSAQSPKKRAVLCPIPQYVHEMGDLGRSSMIFLRLRSSLLRLVQNVLITGALSTSRNVGSGIQAGTSG